jgi:putative Mg2+ transporter-C (MgtC) family protein
VRMACGAGLPVLAVAVMVGHFVVVFVFPAVERRLPKSRWAPSSLQISYQEGRGVLRNFLQQPEVRRRLSATPPLLATSRRSPWL